MFDGRAITTSQIAVIAVEGSWFSIRSLAEVMVGPTTTGGQRDLAKAIITASGAGSRPGVALKPVNSYPVREVLELLADRVDHQSNRGSAGEAVMLESVVDTRAMSGSLHKRTASRVEVNYAVSLTTPIAGEDFKLPTDPYILGAWLGDGSTRTSEITSGITKSCQDDSGVTDQQHLLAQLLVHYPLTKIKRSDDKVLTVSGLSTDLRVTGVLGAKYIPAIYLRASVANRLAVLQGLMDTDGTCDMRGRCSIDLCNKQLADGVLELLRSLGIRVRQTSGPAAITEIDPEQPDKKRRRQTSTRYRMSFTTDVPVFRLPRKLIRLPKTLRITQKRTYLVGIRAVGDKRVRHIIVDHPEDLYLTHGFIPTHGFIRRA